MRPRGTSGEPPRRSWRRWLLRPLSFLAKLLALAVVGALVLVHFLDQPWLKVRVQRLVRASAGVDIDYRTVRLALLSGVEIDDLVVLSPPEVRAVSPDLLRVGRLAARWSLGALIGRTPPISRLALSDVALTVVVDENGKTSFDALSSSSSSSSLVPLSHQAANYLSGAPPLGRIDLERAAVSLLRTKQGAPAERFELHGLSLGLNAGALDAGSKGWRLNGALGAPDAPLALALTRTRGDLKAAAQALAWMTVEATPTALAAALDLRMVQQDFAASVAAAHWLHAEARLRFDAGAGRTEITIDHTEAGDGALVAEAAVDVPDEGAPMVRHARGELDLAQLLRWLPPDLVPVTAERGRVHAEVDCLIAGKPVRMSACNAESKGASIDADLSKISVSDPAWPLRIDTARLSLRAQATKEGGIAGRGSVTLGGTQLPSLHLAADGLGLDLDGQQGSDGAISGRLGVRFARLEQKKGDSLAVIRDGHLELHTEALHVDPEQPLATRGDLAVSLDVGSLDARALAIRAMVDGLSLRAHAALQGRPPYAVEIGAPMSRLRLFGPGDRLLLDAPARLDLQARDVRPDRAHPAATRGVFHAAADIGGAQASLDATKAENAVDYTLHAAAPSLEVVRPLLPDGLAKAAPWERMGLTVQSSGRVELGANPKIRQSTEIEIARPAFELAAARSLSLSLESEGNALQHQAKVDLHAAALVIDGGSPKDDRLTLSASVDRERRALQFQLATEGRATSKLSGSLSFEPAPRALRYDLEGHFGGLADLAPLAAKVRGLDAFDLAELGVDLSAHGRLLGVVDGVSSDGTLALAPSPARSAAADGNLDLKVAHFRWAKGDTAVIAPAVAWHGEMRIDGERRTLESRAEIGAIHLDLGSKDVDLTDIRDEGRAAFKGDLTDPEVELQQRLSIHGVEQDVVPEYPLGDLDFALTAERTRAKVVHVSEMKVANGVGGTSLSVSGNIDLGEEHRTLSVITAVTQDLGRLVKAPERFRGRGKTAVEATVTSPDFSHFRVRALVKGEDVTVVLPGAGVEVDNANGEVPVAVALEVSPHGTALEWMEKANPYSMLRFADQHPLLSRSGFLSVARLKTPFVTVAPLIGNLAIEQNVISLRQFEVGVRGGTITGQCALDWNGPKSTVELHVRASGVQSSHGEPFDGNIAVTFSAAGHTIDGRAEVLRIGERHLLDLLDLEDPLHVNPAMNRIRFALVFGYPKTMRLVFDHGFASAHLELGGLASLVSISELRGIPMGPIIDKALAPAPAGAETGSAAQATP